MARPVLVYSAALLVVSVMGWTIGETGEDRRIRHGQYLVERVAMCVYCHSPKDEGGHIVWERRLEGGHIPVQAPKPGQPWAFRAPSIAGLPGYAREDAVTLLTTGIDRSGRTPRPPMPPFRFTREDAEAIVAYLESLAGCPVGCPRGQHAHGGHRHGEHH